MAEEMGKPGQQVPTEESVANDPILRSQQALDALTGAAKKYGGFDKIPANASELKLALGVALANTQDIKAVSTADGAAAGFTDPVVVASNDDGWKDSFKLALRQAPRDLAIAGGVIAGMFQTVGDGLIGAGGLVKDLLLAQQFLLRGGDIPFNRWIPGFEARQEAYKNVRALGEAVSVIAKDPSRYIGDTIGKTMTDVSSKLAEAQSTDALGDWFLYGVSMGKVTVGVASTVAGAAGVARLTTAGAAELNTLLRTRIDELAPDVRGKES